VSENFTYPPSDRGIKALQITHTKRILRWDIPCYRELNSLLLIGEFPVIFQRVIRPRDGNAPRTQWIVRHQSAPNGHGLPINRSKTAKSVRNREEHGSLQTASRTKQQVLVTYGFFFPKASPESAQFCAFLRLERPMGVPETALEALF
jgi:hypothetical protein